MMKTIQIEVPDMEYKKGNTTLKIYQEMHPLNPREWDNNGIMHCWHSRYKLGDIPSSPPDYVESEDNDAKQLIPSIYVCLPLYLYDHSSLSISTNLPSCNWDTSQIGYIYTTLQKLSEMGHAELPAKDKVIEWLKSEVEEYNQYLQGDVWRFELFEDEELVDSCSGFFGTNFNENGLLDHAGIQSLDDWEEIIQ